MGVINVTPDSFSDGGLWLEPEAAVAHGHSQLDAGADLLDVGGESTRPGASRPEVSEELDRVLPVVTELSASGAVVSIDTMRAEVASAAVRAGASMVNDVSGGQADPDMLGVVADLGVPYVLMHWRGHSSAMQDRATYADLVGEVSAELSTSIKAATEAGIDPARIAVDPGLGFAKIGEHNWTLLRRLDELHGLGLPLLVGASRKAFLGAVLELGGTPRSPLDRDDASAAVSVLAALSGAWCVRVHDVRRSLDAVRVASRWAAESVPRGD